MLHGEAHRRAVVGAVEQEFLQQRASPATKPERMPGQFERFDRLENTTSRVKSVAPELVRGLQRAERRLVVEVDLGVALVGGDDEAVAVRQLEQALPVLEAEHLAARDWPASRRSSELHARLQSRRGVRR